MMASLLFIQNVSDAHYALIYERLFQIGTQSLFMCFWSERRLGVRLRRARGVMGKDDTHDTPRAPQPNPQSFLTPKTHK